MAPHAIPITESLRALYEGDGGKRLVAELDRYGNAVAADELRKLSPELCSWCRKGIGGALYEIPETGRWVHREQYGPDDWEDTPCYASALHERATVLETMGSA